MPKSRESADKPQPFEEAGEPESTGTWAPLLTSRERLGQPGSQL